MPVSPNINQIDFLRNNISEHIPAKLAYWDRDLVLKYANSDFLNFHGQDFSLSGKNITMQELMGDNFLKLSPYIKKVRQGEKQVFECEILNAADLTHYIEYHFFPDVEFGEVIGFYSCENDISKFKRIENELKNSNVTVIEQNERLKNFANIVTHNLRSYSNNLESVVNILKETKDEDTKNQLLVFLNDISKSFSSTIQNLNEIVDIFNNSQVHKERLNIKENIDKVLLVLNQQLESTGAIINIRVEENVYLISNPAYLESILLNILSNAIKYRHDDRQPMIDIESVEEKDFVRLQIKDNGQGIDLNKFGKDLFKMNKTFHKNPDAKGIGLFITKQQVETMGGKIEVISDGEQGTTFIVYFRK